MKTVIIGRFQPLHNGHLALFDKALSFGDEVVVVLGSAKQARTPKNPFTAAEREVMIRAAYPGRPMSFVHLRDYHDDELWNDAVRQAVGDAARIVGMEKDDSSYYLRNFPQWERVSVTPREELSATEVRNLLFADLAKNSSKWLLLETRLPAAVLDYLRAWSETPAFARMQAEFDYYAGYAEQWGHGPHLTADAVMINAGKVLLIRRGGIPGKGLLALPGGFLEHGERLLDCAIREMREETGIDFTRTYLERFLVGQSVRDFPGRSLRGRVVSQVFVFHLDTREPPPLKAGDDASEALWVPIEELPALEDCFFEDHFLILAGAVASISSPPSHCQASRKVLA